MSDQVGSQNVGFLMTRLIFTQLFQDHEPSEEEMMRMFSGMGMNGQGAGEGFMPMMQGMMKTLLSKEVLYPSLKEINDKVKFQKHPITLF